MDLLHALDYLLVLIHDRLVARMPYVVLICLAMFYLLIAVLAFRHCLQLEHRLHFLELRQVNGAIAGNKNASELSIRLLTGGALEWHFLSSLRLQ